MNDNSSIRIRSHLEIHRGAPDFVPFIGVFFIMLIFFMLGSSFVQVSGIPVDLPTAQVRNSLGAKKIVVTVDREGNIYYNDVRMNSVAALKNSLMETVSASRERVTIILRADASAYYGTVASIMSIAEELNTNVFLPTAPPAPSLPEPDLNTAD